MEEFINFQLYKFKHLLPNLKKSKSLNQKKNSVQQYFGVENRRCAAKKDGQKFGEGYGNIKVTSKLIKLMGAHFEEEDKRIKFRLDGK